MDEFFHLTIGTDLLNHYRINQQAIAALITVSQSSVSRELSRNTGLRGYRHDQAHRTSIERRQA